MSRSRNATYRDGRVDEADIAHLQEQKAVDSIDKPQTGQDVFKPWFKETNPKDAVGIRKVPFSVIPAQVVAEVGLGLLEGARKYGRHNYRTVGIRASVYYDAQRRHMDAWWEGQDVDPDSRLSHVTKAICSLVVLRDAMINGKMQDDRPPPIDEEIWLELNRLASVIIDEYQDAKSPYVKES